MSDDELSRHAVERLRRATDDRDWEAAAALLHDEFVREWPQSRERIRGRDNFVAVNRNYSGAWSMTVDQVIASGNRAASHVTDRIDGRGEVAVSFYELCNGLILRQLEYWTEPFIAPDWRAA